MRSANVWDMTAFHTSSHFAYVCIIMYFRISRMFAFHTFRVSHSSHFRVFLAFRTFHVSHSSHFYTVRIFAYFRISHISHFAHLHICIFCVPRIYSHSVCFRISQRLGGLGLDMDWITSGPRSIALYPHRHIGHGHHRAPSCIIAQLPAHDSTKFRT